MALLRHIICAALPAAYKVTRLYYHADRAIYESGLIQ